MGSSSDSGDLIGSPTNRPDDENNLDALLNAEPGEIRELSQSTAEAVVERGASHLLSQESSQPPGPGDESDLDHLIAIQSGHGSVSRPLVPPTENALNDNGVNREDDIEEMMNFLNQSSHVWVSRPPLQFTLNAPNENGVELDDDLMDEEIINKYVNEINPVFEE